jgi:hypothetical protein
MLRPPAAAIELGTRSRMPVTMQGKAVGV